MIFRILFTTDTTSCHMMTIELQFFILFF